jgi:hypothetical protein
MKDSEIQTILNGFKNYFRLRKILSYFCYFLIFILLSFYFSNFFEKKRTVRIVSQLNDKQKNLNAEKVMTNPRITIKHDDGKTYSIKAKKAFHLNEEEIALQEVFADSEIGTISAGELEIKDEGNHLIFTKNPVLILNK